MKSLISACVHRPLSSFMAFVGIILVCVIAATGLGIDYLPRVKLPELVINASFAGLPASEMRVLVTIPLEDALSSMKGLKKISSISSEGASTISLEFHWGADMRMAAVEAREIIDIAYVSLPSDMKKPLVLPVDPTDEEAMTIAIFPKDGDITLARRLAEREIKARLQQASGVGYVTIVGGKVEEVHVLVDENKMVSRDLDMEALGNVISGDNYEYPAGLLREGGSEYLVKVNASVTSPEALSDLLIRTGEKASPFRLGDIAEVKLSTREALSTFSMDGREGVGILVRARDDTSPVELSASLRSELDGIRKSYGRDLDIAIARDKSSFVSSAIGNIGVSTLLGVGIAFFVLLFFVRDIRTCLVLVSSIPISILISLALLKLTGKTINIMSLGGLDMGIGLMVDNSTVVLENLQKRLLIEKRGVTKKGVIEATTELSSSNMGATMTSIIVFLPVLFLPGVLGAAFSDLSLAVIFSQLASFFVSITLVPVCFYLISRKKEAVLAKEGRVYSSIERGFRKLSRAFYRKPLTLGIVIALFALLGLLSFGSLSFEFFPPIDNGEADIVITLPHGSSIERAKDFALRAEELAKGIAGIDRCFARAGGEDEDSFYHADPDDRKELVHLKAMLTTGQREGSAAILSKFIEALKAEGFDASGISARNPMAPLIGLGDEDVRLLVRGENQAEARSRASAVVAFVNGIYSANGTEDRAIVSPTGEKPELRAKADRELLAKSGLDMATVAKALRTALDGSYATRVKVDGRETNVRILLKDYESLGPERLKTIPLRLENSIILLGSIAEFESVTEPPALLRVDRSDVAYASLGAASLGAASLGAAPSGAVTGEGLNMEQKSEIARKAAQEYPFASFLRDTATSEQVPTIILTFLLILALLYLALGAQFESFALPLILLLSLPLALGGIFTALALGGKSINFDAILGVIVLFGVVVNNSAILYERYKIRAQGLLQVPLVSIYRGTADRLKPIMITVLTTAFAMLPVALDRSQATTQSSMALAIIGGLIVSTTLTLFVAPLAFRAYLKRKR